MVSERSRNIAIELGKRWGIRAAFVLCLLAFPALADVRVVDGDTVRIDGETVRIAGIDAPELHPCRCPRECELGEAAKAFTAKFLEGRIVIERIPRKDKYGRTLANLSVNGVDLGEALIAAKLARPWDGRRRPWCRATSTPHP